MLNRNRSHWLETISLALCAAVLTLGLPGAADAKDRGDRHRSEFHRQDSRTPYRHARDTGHSYRPHARRQHPPHYAHGVKYSRHHANFHCRACNQTFRYQRDFYGHVHHRHHVPFWRIPFLLVHASVGWIFYG